MTLPNAQPSNFGEHMPDLSNLDNILRLNLFLNALSFRAGPTNIKARLLWTHYIRLIDQAIRGYNATRRSLGEITQDPGDTLGAWYRAATQMETCLFTLQRAVRFARRLRLNRDCTGCSDLEVTSDAVAGRLQRLVDALNNMEQRILARDISSEQGTLLGFEPAGIAMDTIRISYAELSGWIGELYALAIEMTDYKDD